LECSRAGSIVVRLSIIPDDKYCSIEIKGSTQHLPSLLLARHQDSPQRVRTFYRRWNYIVDDRLEFVVSVREAELQGIGAISRTGVGRCKFAGTQLYMQTNITICRRCFGAQWIRLEQQRWCCELYCFCPGVIRTNPERPQLPRSSADRSCSLQSMFEPQSRTTP
jgi:hypothetical protein